MLVMLSAAKRLVFLATYKNEILRLRLRMTVTHGLDTKYSSISSSEYLELLNP